MFVKQLYITIFFTLFVVVLTYSQDTLSKKELRTKFYKADKLLEDENFIEAMPLFEELLTLGDTSSLTFFKVGICSMFLIEKRANAINYLQESLNRKPPKKKEKFKKDFDKWYYLALAYHLNYKFENAIATYDTILKKLGEKEGYYHELIKSKKSISQNAIELIKDTIKVEVNKVASLNSEYTEHSPVVSADEKIMIFTSKKKLTETDRKLPNGEYYEDLFYSEKKGDRWTKPISIGNLVNTVDNESSCSLSPDGQSLIVYREDNLYRSDFKNGEWQALKAFSPTVNSRHRETHGALSADGKTLYFTSNRPGGYGGLDIYYTKFGLDSLWGPAINLGPEINTEFDEEGPFIHPDGETLYFSSKGHKTMGGYDVFVSIKEDSVWGTPQNIGFPINTVDDDVFFRPMPNGKMAYYASERYGGQGRADIYTMYMENFPEKKVKILKKQIISNDSILANTEITVTNLKNLDDNYKITPREGDSTFVAVFNSEMDVNVKVNANNHLVHTENFLQKTNDNLVDDSNIKLTPIKKGRTFKSYEIWFNENSPNLDMGAKAKIMAIAENIHENDVLVVDISASRKTGTLPEERVEAVSMELQKLGIAKDRIYFNKVNLAYHENVVLLSVFDRISMETITAMFQKKKENRDTVHVSNIMFKLDQFSTTEYIKELNHLAIYMLKNEDAKIRIIGFTDASASAGYNINLSVKRAKFVRNFLLNKGVDGNRIEYLGNGEKNPISHNFDNKKSYYRESMKYNRRVEIEVVRQGEFQELVVNQIDVPEQFRIQNENKESHNWFYSILVGTYNKANTTIDAKNNTITKHRSTDGYYYYYHGLYRDFDKAKNALNKIKKDFPTADIFVNDCLFEN